MMDFVVMVLLVVIAFGSGVVFVLTARNYQLYKCNEWLLDYFHDTSNTCLRLNEEYEHLHDAYCDLVRKYGELLDAYEGALAALGESTDGTEASVVAE